VQESHSNNKEARRRKLFGLSQQNNVNHQLRWGCDPGAVAVAVIVAEAVVGLAATTADFFFLVLVLVLVLVLTSSSTSTSTASAKLSAFRFFVLGGMRTGIAIK
jgi:hypothetical protein